MPSPTMTTFSYGCCRRSAWIASGLPLLCATGIVASKPTSLQPTRRHLDECGTAWPVPGDVEWEWGTLDRCSRVVVELPVHAVGEHVAHGQAQQRGERADELPEAARDEVDGDAAHAQRRDELYDAGGQARLGRVCLRESADVVGRAV